MFLRKVSPMIYSGAAGVDPPRERSWLLSRLKTAPKQLLFESTRPRLKSAGVTDHALPAKVNASSTLLSQGNFQDLSATDTRWIGAD